VLCMCRLSVPSGRRGQVSHRQRSRHLRRPRTTTDLLLDADRQTAAAAAAGRHGCTDTAVTGREAGRRTCCIFCWSVSRRQKSTEGIDSACTRMQINPLTSTVDCCHVGAAIKHLVPDRIKPSFVIFDIRAL